MSLPQCTNGDRYAANLDAIAWCDEGYDGPTHPAGQKVPNAWGLHDMLGNVREWVHDWWGGYPGGSVTDPRGPDSGSGRNSRGGSWSGDLGDCRSSSRRFAFPPGWRAFYLGFRLLRIAP